MAGIKPLLLMTRPHDASQRFIAALPEWARNGLDLCVSPLMEIETVDSAVDLADVRGVIFTSANAVRAASELGLAADVPAYCVGKVTTQTARAARWRAETCGETAGELVDQLKRIRPDTPLLHLSGRHVRRDLASDLSDAGLATRNCPIYDQLLRPLSQAAIDAVSKAQTVIAPVFSPRTGAHLASELPESGHIHVLAMSEAVAKAMESRRWASLSVSSEPTAESLGRDILTLLNRPTRVEGNPAAQ